MARSNPKVVVNNTAEPEVPTEVMAKSIVDMAVAMKKLSATRLTRNALVVLIADRSKLGKRTIEIVLNNLDDLEATWLKPKRSE